jgi:hypothetical protein
LGDIVDAFVATPPPPTAATTSPSRGFVDVVVDYPRGCYNKRRWRGGENFSCPPSPTTPRPPPSILMTTKGTSLPPPMQRWGGCGGRRMKGGAGLQQGDENGGTSVVPWAWMKGRRRHWLHKGQQGAAQQGVARCAVAQ